MMQESIEERRSDVYRLLTECVDQKVLRGGTALAIEKATIAYQLATERPALFAPWPQLAAYRLAHLKLRTGDLGVATLHEIDGLLSEASQYDVLGPLPIIYHLAVLSRLHVEAGNASQRRRIKNRIETTHQKAIQEVRRRSLSIAPSIEHKVALQDATFNLLELAAYFLGLSYDALEGLAALDSMDPMKKGRWFLMGQGIERILMTEELARCEFESRTKPDKCILIELNDNGARWGTSADGCAGLEETNPEFAKLVLWACSAAPLSAKDLRRRVVGTDGDDPESRFRQVKRRTIAGLRELTGKATLDVFMGDRLTDELPVVGLVHNPALRS